MAVASVPLVARLDARTGAASDQRSYRLVSLDLLRGLVIVIMALDHVRDFFLTGAVLDPTTDPNVTPVLFMTRWITHFCAPVFVLLAGTSAGMMATRKTAQELGRFLLARGLWLIAVEFFIISTATTFSPRGIAEFGGRITVPMQVIWTIGISMVVLSGAQFLGRRACLIAGAVIVAGHNLLDTVWPQTMLLDEKWPAWVALHSQMSLGAGPYLLVFVYPVLAWIGVMLAGFGLAGVFERSADDRGAALRTLGLWVTAGFIVLRVIGVYGDPNPWQWQSRGVIATAIDFLNTTKYPPSLDFLLMTLGPAAILCSFADRFTGPIARFFVVFGRVPFAFYVAHVFLIHTLSVLLGVAQGFRAGQLVTIFFFYPTGYGLPLVGVYVVWALVIATLYPLCRWMAALKARRRDWWLSYV